jgi:hypothetical protein
MHPGHAWRRAGSNRGAWLTAAGLSHPNIVAVFDSGSEAGTIWSWRVWKRNPRPPHQHRGVARVRPARRQGRRVGRRARHGPDEQVRRAVDGFRHVVERGGLVGELTVLTGRAAPAPCRGHRPLQTCHKSSQMGDEVSWLDGTNSASFELLASQMRRAVAEPAKS